MSSENKIRINQLTLREQDIVKLIAQGYSSNQISTILNVSSATINTQRRSIYNKLQVGSVAELVRFALKSKMVS